MLSHGSILRFFDDRWTTADDGRVGGNERDVDVRFRMEFLGKPAGIEDQVVAFRRPAFEFHLCAALDPVDVEHPRVDVLRARAFV